MTGDHNNTNHKRTLIEPHVDNDKNEMLSGKDTPRRGATMVEYALLLVFVLLAAFLSLQFFGDSVVAVFDASADTVQNAPNVGP